MKRFKCCPKCQGDVFVDWSCDEGGWYEYCLQCGYRHYLPVVVKERVKLADVVKAKKRKKVA
ncbi:MAG: hypothetical protein WC749_14490 [Dehalococcoidia bacterium]